MKPEEAYGSAIKVSKEYTDSVLSGGIVGFTVIQENNIVYLVVNMTNGKQHKIPLNGVLDDEMKDFVIEVYKHIDIGDTDGKLYFNNVEVIDEQNLVNILNKHIAEGNNIKFSINQNNQLVVSSICNFYTVNDYSNIISQDNDCVYYTQNSYTDSISKEFYDKGFYLCLSNGDITKIDINSNIQTKNFNIVDKYSNLPLSNSEDILYYVKNDEVIDEDITYNKGLYLWDNSLEIPIYTRLDISDGEENKINIVKVNEVEQAIDNKTINITVPTKTSDLINDNNFVKDTDTATTDKFGVVKPDNSTITVQDGVLSANIDGLIDDTTSTNNKTYSSNKLENDFTKKSDVLTLTNTIVYTPTGEYHPATKKYVDDAISALNGIMQLKSRVDSVENLPLDAVSGDVYYVGLEDADAFDTYVKLDDGNWLKIGNTNIKLADFYNKNEVDTLLNSKITICNTLPTASVNYGEQCYFNTVDGCIYQCILEDSGYKWNKIISNDSCIYKSNVEPTDKSKLWIDNSDSENVLIKIYNDDTLEWIALNSCSSDFVESITYANGILYVKPNNKPIKEFKIGGGASINESSINGNIIVDDVEIKVYDDTDVMKKSEYESELNKGNVKASDVAETVRMVADNSEPNVYYGHDSEGVEGLHPFPIGTQDESKIITKEYSNITEGWEQVVTESLLPLDNKVMVSVMKNVSNSTNVDITIKDFNIENDITINHTDDVLVTNEGMSIKKVYSESPITNSDGLSEIDISKYLNILNIEVEG